jgi:hypothetical protein
MSRHNRMNRLIVSAMYIFTVNHLITIKQVSYWIVSRFSIKNVCIIFTSNLIQLNQTGGSHG